MTAPVDDPRDPYDAHLRAALRHAPDRDVAPSPALSAQILAQARQAAARPAATAAGPGWVERWFGWMSRPVAAGAFGTLLIAGFVGMMWRDGPPPEALPGADQPAAGPTAPAPMPAPAPVPVLAGRPPAVEPPPTPKPVADARRARQESAAATAPAAAQAQKSAPAPDAVSAERAAPAGAPAPPTTGAPSFAPAAPPTPPIAATPPAPPPPVAAAPAAESAAPAPATTLRDSAAPAQQRPQAAPAPATRLAAASIDPLAAALSSLTSATDSAWRERLLALRSQTQGRWIPAEPLPPDSGEAVITSAGQALGRLRVEAAQVTWQSTDGRAWRALLPAPPAAAPSR